MNCLIFLPKAHQVEFYLLLCLLAAGFNWNTRKHAGAHALSRQSAHNGPLHVSSARLQAAVSEFVAGTWRFLSVLSNLCAADGVLPTASFCRHSWRRRQLLIYQQKWYSVCVHNGLLHGPSAPFTLWGSILALMISQIRVIFCECWTFLFLFVFSRSLQLSLP